MSNPLSHVVVVILIALVGCKSTNAAITETSPVATESPPARATELLTEIPTEESTLSPSPRGRDDVTPLPMTLTATANQIPDNFFFQDDFSDCTPPCWGSIVVDESSLADASTFLITRYGDPLFEAPFNRELPRGLDGNIWVWADVLLGEPPSAQSFAIGLVYDNQTQIVKAITFVFYGDRFNPYLTPQRILRQLGTPTQMFIRLEDGGQGSHFDLKQSLIFENGMVFNSRSQLPGEERDGVTTGEFCLDEVYPEVVTSIFITEPISSDLATLNPLQHHFFDPYYEDVVPLAERLNISLEEITTRAVNEDNACFLVTAANR